MISDTRFGPMVHAQLGVAAENSGKLVSHVRQEARQIAEREGKDLIIIDGPPALAAQQSPRSRVPALHWQSQNQPFQVNMIWIAS